MLIRELKTIKLYSVLIILIIILILNCIFLYSKITYKKGLRICTWNVEWFGLPQNKELFNSIDLPLYDKMIDNMYDIKYYMNIVNADIICFQEIASTITLNVLTEYLKDYDLYSDASVVGKSQQYNVFLVKKNINVTLFKVLDDKHKMIRLDFKYNGEEISLYNVHLKSDYSGNFARKRREQTDFLYDYIQKHDNKNIIISGDMNSDPGSEELKKLEEKFINIIFSRKSMLPLGKRNTIWWDKDENDLITKDEIKLVDYYLTSINIYNMVDQMLIFTILYQKLFEEDSANKISDHYPIILDLH
jgi:exonuclease III